MLVDRLNAGDEARVTAHLTLSKSSVKGAWTSMITNSGTDSSRVQL